MRTAALLASTTFIGASLLPLVRREAWWIRVLDFPRPQITLGAVLSAALLYRFRDRGNSVDAGVLALLAGCTAYQGWEMSRYTRVRTPKSLPAESDDPKRRIRLLIANVLQTNRNAGRYLDLVAQCDPDLVVLAETDTYWEQQLRPLEQAYPYCMKCPLSNTYGLLFYSRLRLSDTQTLYRVQSDVPSFTAIVKLLTGDDVRIHIIHPRPPHVGVDTEHRDAELVLVAKELENETLPAIVTGDLNDVAWSHTTRLFLRISGMLDPRLGRKFCNTFHAHHPLFRWPLDHLFHSRAFRLVKFERGPKTESDHFPVIVELSFEPEVRREQERPEPEPEDFQEAERKIDNVAAD